MFVVVDHIDLVLILLRTHLQGSVNVFVGDAHAWRRVGQLRQCRTDIRHSYVGGLDLL